MSILIFVFGLIIGSFLNAVIHRLHTGQAIWERHSRCQKCRHKLGFWDLIPLLSFCYLRGRCRYCGKKISWQYPAVEMATGVIFVLIYTMSVIPAKAGIQLWIPGSSPRMTDYTDLFFQFAFASFLIVIFVYDLKHYLILDRIVFPAAVLAAGYQILQHNFLNGIWGALFLAGFFWLLYVSSHGRFLGFGDVKLGIYLGLLIPWPQTLILFLLAYGLGAAISLGLIITGLKKLKDPLPFGTFLTLAAFLAMLWGEEMWSWYFRLLGI